ncbi:MAG: flagellar biosynthetic protein FliO [Pseudomonadales bacterium]|nr:flagellar biosynthetic protein FliO [Pseudomonadales bacterium]
MKPFPGTSLLLILMSISTGIARAEAPNKVGVASGDIFTLVLGLAFVLLLIFGCAWLIKRFGALPNAGNGAIKVISVLPMGTRERICLVEVGGKQLLLGVTAAQISILHTFEEPAVDAAQFASSFGKNSEFAQKLHQLMSRK